MKKILVLLSGLALVTQLSVNLYSCNSLEKEDPKVSQKNIDELVDLFNYYNMHNDSSSMGNPSMIWFDLDPEQKELFTKYKELQLDKIYKLSLSQILLNSIFFSSKSLIETFIRNENGQYDEEFIERESDKFNFLNLNLQEPKRSEDFPHEHGQAFYWEQVWNNPQIKVIADDEKIMDEEKGINPSFEVINLKLQYIQKNETVITSLKAFKVKIKNQYIS